MSKKYKAKFVHLKTQYEELYDYMNDIREDNKQYLTELNYYAAFIEWKNLNDEFSYFRDNAYEKTDEDRPFSRLTIE